MDGTGGVSQHLPNPCVVRTKLLSLSRESRRPRKEDKKPSDREQIDLWTGWKDCALDGENSRIGHGAILHTVHVALPWTDIQCLL